MVVLRHWWCKCTRVNPSRWAEAAHCCCVALVVFSRCTMWLSCALQACQVLSWCHVTHVHFGPPLLLLLLLPQAAILQQTIPSRLHVWLMTDSVDLGAAGASQQLPPGAAAADARRRAGQGGALREAAAGPPAGEPLAAADPRPTCLGSYPIIQYRTQVWHNRHLSAQLLVL